MSLRIEGQDMTPPDIGWVTVTGKNLLQVKVIDGSTVKAVTGTFSAKNRETFSVVLNDKGQEGDRVESDGVFTAVCPPQSFDFYQLTLDLEDAHSNKSKREISEPYVLHR